MNTSLDIQDGIYGVSTHIIPSLKGSVYRLLRILYSGKGVNSIPVGYAKQEQVGRNQAMFDRHKWGDTSAEIARDFGISIFRVHQIVSNLITKQ